MRTWVPPSRAGGQTSRKRKSCDLRSGLRCLLSPAWRHLCWVHGGAAPSAAPRLWEPQGGGSSPPGTTSCLSSRALWSPHLYRAGAGGAAGRSELQTCLPSSLRFSSLARCAGQGGDRRRARDTHPVPSSQEPQGSGSLRGQGSFLGENQPKFSVANLSLPGLSLGQGTLNPAGVFSRVSWDPYLT